MPPFRRIANLAIACLCISALATSGLGAVAQSPAASAVTPDAAPSAVSTILHANANLVLVDVVVNDHGNAVHGLAKGSFHVFDNGREQTISSFDEHRLADVSAPAKPVKLPPNTYTNLPVYPEATAVNVLLLDDLNTPMEDQAYVRTQMIQFMGKMKPGTTLAVFKLSRHLRMIAGFTTDIAKLTKDIQASKTGSQDMLDSDTGVTVAQIRIARDLGARSPSGGAVFARFAANTASDMADDRARDTLTALQQLAHYLNAVPGRKNLIWFSSYFPSMLRPGMRTYTEEMRETIEMLAAARVAVYPMDANGLRTQLISLPEQATMKEMAELSGGKAHIENNELQLAMAEALEHGASYYTIGYVPKGEKFDGKSHKIRVHMEQSSYQLAYRNEYYAISPDKPSTFNPGAPASLMTTATLLGAPPETQILFLARVLPATDPEFKDLKISDLPAGKPSKDVKGPLQRYIVDLTIDPHSLNYENVPDGTHQASLEFVLVAYDSNYNQVNFLDRAIQLNLHDQHYAKFLATGTPVRLALDLPAGENSLLIAVQDTAANRAGSIEIPVTVAR
jgi:VWFA-related protein